MTNEKSLLDFINAYYDKELAWAEVSRQLSLEEELIEKYKGKLDWNNIFIHQTLSKEFKDRYLYLVTIDNRYFKYCFICDGLNKISYYKKDMKIIRDCSNRWSYFYYCPRCLR